MSTNSEPIVIIHEPFQIVGVYCTFDGEHEDAGWRGAEAAFFARLPEISNRKDSLVIGFLYHPHRDHPEIAEEVRSCFVGVDVLDLEHVPHGMSVVCYSGGSYAVVACRGNTPSEPGEGVGEAIDYLHETWMPAHGFRAGDACFACSDQQDAPPPYVEYVYMKLEPVDPSA